MSSKMRPSTVSLFSGAGGESWGKHLALEDLGIPPSDLCHHAVNHWDLAVSVHGRNLPWVSVHREDITSVTAATYGLTSIDFLWASPSCVHHSRARGGKPKEDQQRSHAWEVIDRWLKVANVGVVLLENVPEFSQWGPLDEAGNPIKSRQGESFRAFVAALRHLGYEVDWRVLCAADYGDPTTRRRLFLQAVKDGRPVRWPSPTHRDPRKIPTPDTAHLPTWRPASACIDWSIPCPSIFNRRKPLAEATLRRIAVGIDRFVLRGNPHLIGRDTPTTHCMVQTSYGERPGQSPRVLDLELPLGTVVAGGSKHGLVAAFLSKHYGGPSSYDKQPPGLHPDQSLGTITAQDKHSLVTVDLDGREDRSEHVASFLQSYYSTGCNNHSPRLPLPTVTTTARHNVVSVTIDGQTYRITDIGLRMLEPKELAAAMGFPADYQWLRPDGSPLSKREAIKMIGNACPVGTVRELVKCVLGPRASDLRISAAA